MIIAVPPGHNVRIHGKSQGYLGLPVHHEVVEGQPMMFTAWTPTPEELEALNKDANVMVSFIGSIPMPMIVSVGKPPEET